MISPNDINLPLQTAVLEYFSGEQREMLIILSGSAVLAVLTFWLWLTTRTGFVFAFSLVVLASIVLLSATAVSLLIRDKGISSEVIQGIGAGQHVFTVTAERERISVVLSKYKYYRYAAGAIAVIALAGLMLSSREWVHGLAVGLLLLVVAQVLIDHYSERRAGLYLQRLTAAMAG